MTFDTQDKGGDVEDEKYHLTPVERFVRERVEQAHDRHLREQRKGKFDAQKHRDEAHYLPPTGSFLDRWFPGWCDHLRVRCVHGDEVNDRGGRRRVCMICGRSLKGPLPRVCFFTGEEHDGFFG